MIESYVDEAYGIMDKTPEGKIAFTRITLRPRIEFGGEKRPAEADLASLHHAAHDECYIASSLRSEVVVEGY